MWELQHALFSSLSQVIQSMNSIHTVLVFYFLTHTNHTIIIIVFELQVLGVGNSFVDFNSSACSSLSDVDNSAGVEHIMVPSTGSLIWAFKASTLSHWPILTSFAWWANCTSPPLKTTTDNFSVCSSSVKDLVTWIFQQTIVTFNAI